MAMACGRQARSRPVAVHDLAPAVGDHDAVFDALDRLTQGPQGAIVANGMLQRRGPGS